MRTAQHIRGYYILYTPGINPTPPPETSPDATDVRRTRLCLDSVDGRGCASSVNHACDVCMYYMVCLISDSNSGLNLQPLAALFLSLFLSIQFRDNRNVSILA